MKQFLGTYKNYDIYLVEDNYTTGNDSYCEAINNTLNRKYIVFAADFEKAKKILDCILKVTNESNKKSYYNS